MGLRVIVAEPMNVVYHLFASRLIEYLVQPIEQHYYSSWLMQFIVKLQLIQSVPSWRCMEETEKTLAVYARPTIVFAQLDEQRQRLRVTCVGVLDPRPFQGEIAK